MNILKLMDLVKLSICLLLLYGADKDTQYSMIQLSFVMLFGYLLYILSIHCNKKIDIHFIIFVK